MTDITPIKITYSVTGPRGTADITSRKVMKVVRKGFDFDDELTPAETSEYHKVLHALSRDVTYDEIVTEYMLRLKMK